MNESNFQFGLRHLFVLVTILCAYFGLMQCTNQFFATLALGFFIIWAMLILLRVENMIVAAIVGTLIAVIILALSHQAFPKSSGVWLAWLAYPMFGYVFGLVWGADQQLRSG